MTQESGSFDLHIDMFRLRFSLFWGPAGYKRFRKLALSWRRDPKMYPESPDCGGMATGSIVWLRDPTDLVALAHELHHTTFYMAPEYGLDGHEGSAYFFTHLFRECLEKLRLRGFEMQWE